MNRQQLAAALAAGSITQAQHDTALATLTRVQFAAAAAQTTPAWNLESAGGVASLHLYGPIGSYWDGIRAADVVREVRDLDVATLNVYINSPGGDVYEGIAIRNVLRETSAHVVVQIDSLAASAASFIACAGDEIVISDHAEIMIHDAWNIAIGNADDIRTVADDLDRLSDNIAAMYAERAGGDPAAWRAVMKAETWYSAEEAVAAGLADRLASAPTEADAPAAHFDLSMYAHAGRAAAPAPVPVAALAAPRKEPRMNREQLAAALAAGQITQEQHDAALAALNIVSAEPAPAAALAPAAGAPGVAVPVEYATGPQGAQPAPVARITERPQSLMNVARDAAALIHAGASTAEWVAGVNNALAPVLESADVGGGFTAPDRIGEVWTARPEGRPVIDSLGGTKPLTATRIEGWKWKQPTPAPQPYEGELAEIPTGTWETVPVSEVPGRWAFGNKIDRIHRDLGSADLIASLFNLLGQGYDAKSDEAVSVDLLAAATALTGGAASLVEAFVKSFLQLKRIGATPSKMWMAEDLFVEWAQLKIADLPAWIANSSGFVKLDGNTSLAGVFDADVDFKLPAGTFETYDRRAVTVYESPQIKLEAQDIAHGAIDIGFFAYGGTLVNDARAVLKTTVTPTP
ncbi:MULTISPECIES: head maturation protease, ClpP-related [Microbacterium]|uniref:ATP-dependent Clp protease proteolytic subunit n=1 Tax=Microbacterium maritypicum MF109 TaxID=1333857 RepID=T5KKU7_MICMQ|nr:MULTISPECIES: head maturation protease, ClpP-related [Microbacterium]EQM75911.1 peptidase [Microbacterium maritypicum MF109]